LSTSKRSKDFQLVLAAQQDRKKFSALYNKYFKEIFLFILKKTADETLAAELSSNTFMKAMVNLTKYRDMGFPFSSWLYRIASNEVYKYYRDNNKVQEVEINDRDAVTFLGELEIEDNTNHVNHLMKCLSEMKEDQSDLIEMRYFEKLSFNEIGEVLGITGNNAKIKVYRAIDKLKKLFHNK
jgi:RNA polymerase sigma-70 factor (ECF subfamily)